MKKVDLGVTGLPWSRAGEAGGRRTGSLDFILLEVS